LRRVLLWEVLGGDIYFDVNSNPSHSGERLYRGNFGATLRSFSTHAIGAPRTWAGESEAEPLAPATVRL
jgi:hypothetical protein